MRFLLAVIISFVISPCFALSISAEVERGFRYFKYNSDFELHRLAYRDYQNTHAGAKPAIHDLDKLLASWHWWTDPMHAKTAAWYGHNGEISPLRLIQQLRDREIKKEKRTAGYLELSLTLLEKNLDFWEYHPVRIGWASLLFPAHQGPKELGSAKLHDAANVAVCWNRAEQAHSNCGGIDDYLHPAGHTVVVRAVDGADTRILAGTCDWTLDSATGAKFVRPNAGSDGKLSASCAEYVSVFVPSGKSPTVKLQTGGSQAESQLNIDDQLIVGVGDSFSSGEGNPDVPAKLGWAISDQQDWAFDNTTNTDTVTGGPVRKAVGDYFAAQWIDRSCHRSAYSYQVRSALHLAVENAAGAITFLGYACSGAEVNEGLFLPFQGPEYTDNKDAARSYQRAQLPLLLSELCQKYDGSRVLPIPLTEDAELQAIPDRYKFGGIIVDSAYRCQGQAPGAGFKRPIDLMYLSIGGNDLGFGSWIFAAVSSEGTRGSFFPILDGPECSKHPTSCRITRSRMKRLSARYALLRDFIDNRLAFAKRDAPPVLMYTYPVPVQSASGQLCPAGNSGMTVWTNRPQGLEFFKITLNRDQDGLPTLETIDRFTRNKLNGAIATLAAQPGPGGRAWQVMTDYVSKFDGRGFCASKVDQYDSSAPPEPFSGYKTANQANQLAMALQLKDLAIQETLHFPVGKGGGNKEWRPFHPVEDYLPYRHRTRLLRTMNEVYFLINQLKGATQSSKASGMLSLADSARYGSFHPTAEAHALFADSFFGPSDAILRKPRQ